MSVSTELTKAHPWKHFSTAHPGLYTVAVRVADGHFVVEHEDGAAAIRNGHDLAASIPADRLHGADIRVWIEWPLEPDDYARLRGVLRELADWTGTVVWTPPGGGYCDVVPACDDLAVFDGHGMTTRWAYYQPGKPRALQYSTDLDGRLIPAGGLVLKSCPTIALVSVSGSGTDNIAHRYADVVPRTDVFMADLTVLADGRLAASCADKSLFALAPRSLVRILNAHGWTGQQIALVAELNPTQRDGLSCYVQDVNTALGATISIVPAHELPPIPLATSTREDTISDEEPDLDPHEEMFGPDPTRIGEWEAAAMFLARPRLEPTTRRTRPHGLAWLPNVVQANDDAFELFVGSDWSPERVANQGFPTAELFLVGHLGECDTTAPHKVRVRVEPQGAVDLLASGIEPPEELGLALDAAAYIVPAGWLDRCRVILDDDDDSTTHRPVLLRCRGGSHGIDGFPEDVTWSPGGWRKSAVAYATLTDYQAAAKSGLRLYKNKPVTYAGELVELRLGPGVAIDIAASEARIKVFPAVRTILAELRADGVDMQLPPSAFGEVKVTGTFVADGKQWKPNGRERPRTLASLLLNSPVEGIHDQPPALASGQ